MHHQEAISVIRRLGPELTKEAAESVLLRYAEDEDLAPAQLEKLAQAYNMIRQLSHIDASEDRGSSCHQIDTPALLRTYAGDVSKAAAAPIVERVSPTHDAGSVDLMRELTSELTSPEKAADCGCEYPEGEIEVTHPSVPSPSPEADVRYTPAQLKEAAWEAKVDFYMIADEVLKMAACEGRTLQIAQAELDASRVANPVCVSESLNWLAKYAAQQKISREISRHEGPIKEAAFNFETPLSRKIVELAEAFTLTSLFHKVATDLGIPIGELPQSGQVVATPGAKALDDVMSMVEDLPVEEQVETPVEREFADNEPQSDRGGDDSGESASEGGGKGGKGGKGGDGSGQKQTAGDKAAGKGHWLAAIISGATKPVNVAADTVDAAATGARNSLQAVVGKDRVNKNQVKLDDDIMDIRRSILIRRLAASDPVLKDMPLKDVLETYNAIAESNPEVASNPRRVLLAMREAAAYDGITLDSQKLLGDVRGATAKTEGVEADNRKRRYTPA